MNKRERETLEIFVYRKQVDQKPINRQKKKHKTYTSTIFDL